MLPLRNGIKIMLRNISIIPLQCCTALCLDIFLGEGGMRRFAI